MEKPYVRIKVFKRYEGGYFEIVDRRHEMEVIDETVVIEAAHPFYATKAQSRMVERDHVILRTQDEARADRVLASVQNDKEFAHALCD